MQLYDTLCEAGAALRKVDIRRTRKKTADVVRIRSAIGNILTKYYGLTTVEVGRLMGRDHSSVVHYRKIHRARYKSDDEYALLYDNLSRTAMEKHVDSSIEDLIELIRKIGE